MSIPGELFPLNIEFALLLRDLFFAFLQCLNLQIDYLQFE